MDESELLKTLAHGDADAIRRILYARDSLGDLERRPLWSILKDYRTPVEFDDLKPIQARRHGPFRLIILQIPWLYLDPLPYRPLLLMETEAGLNIIGTVLPFNEFQHTELAHRTKEITPLSAWWADWIAQRRRPLSEQRDREAFDPHKPVSMLPIRSAYVGYGLVLVGLLCFLATLFLMIESFETAAEVPAMPAAQLARSILWALSLALAGAFSGIVGLCVIVAQKRRNGPN